MINVDVQIYVSQIKTFFTQNPDLLIELIGNLDKDLFFKNVENESQKNYDSGEDIHLTKKQLIDIVVKMMDLKKKEVKQKVDGIFEITPFGLISLN